MPVAEAKWKIKKWPPFCSVALADRGLAPILWTVASLLRCALQGKQPTRLARNCVSSTQSTSVSAPPGAVEDLEGRDRWVLGRSHLQLLGHSGDGVRCSLWHFKHSFFPNLRFVQPPGRLEQAVTFVCGLWPQRNAGTPPATRLSCRMCGPRGH